MFGMMHYPTSNLQSAPSQLQRDIGIDRAKGVLIFLVVFGHLVSNTSIIELSSTSEWYSRAVFIIYFFHMPAFFYVSGLISFRSLTRVTRGTFFRFTSSKFNRLMVPFFAIGILIALGKIVAISLFEGISLGGHASDSILNAAKDLFWTTDQSPARSIWFLFSYFIFLLMSLPFISSKWLICALFMLSSIIYFVQIPSIFYLNKVGGNLCFFAFGLFWASELKGGAGAKVRMWIAFCAVLILSAVVLEMGRIGEVLRFAVGIASGPIIVAICRRLDERFFIFLGRNTMSIYLLNTMVIGVISLILLLLIGQRNDLWMNLILFIGFPLALLVPICARVILSRMSPKLGKYFS